VPIYIYIYKYIKVYYSKNITEVYYIFGTADQVSIMFDTDILKKIFSNDF
jgi:hypothetical protein